MWYAGSAEELLARYGESPFLSDAVYDFSHPVIKEYIPGLTHDVCLLFNHGEPIAALTQKRIKTYPITGGKGIVCETTDEPQVKEQAIQLLKRLRWHGPAQVEFKLAVDTRSPLLIEINGRFWGTLDLAIHPGIDFPGLTSRLAMGQKVEPHFDYEVGLKYRFIIPHELVHFLRCGNKWRNLPGLFQLGRRTRCDISLTDPFPLPAYLASFAARKRSSKP